MRFLKINLKRRMDTRPPNPGLPITDLSRWEGKVVDGPQLIIITSSGGPRLLHSLSETTVVLWETPGLHLLICFWVKLEEKNFFVFFVFCVYIRNISREKINFQRPLRDFSLKLRDLEAILTLGEIQIGETMRVKKQF